MRSSQFSGLSEVLLARVISYLCLNVEDLTTDPQNTSARLRIRLLLGLELFLALASFGRVLAIAHSPQSSFPSCTSSATVAWVAIFVASACTLLLASWLVFVGAVVFRRRLLDRMLALVASVASSPQQEDPHPMRSRRPTAPHETLISSPASCFLLPFVTHFSLTAALLVVILAVCIFGGGSFDKGSPGFLLTCIVVLGISSVFLLVVSATVEASMTTLQPSAKNASLRCIVLLNSLFVLAAFYFYGFFCPSTLQSVANHRNGGGGHEFALAWRMSFASLVLFWEMVTFSVLWWMLSAVAESSSPSCIAGALWARLLGGSGRELQLASDYVEHEDAKASAEAALASVGGGVLLCVLLLPLDLCALVLCGPAPSPIFANDHEHELGHDTQSCEPHTRIFLAATAASVGLWLLSTFALFTATRVSGPPVAILAAPQCVARLCCTAVGQGGHVVWALDALQHWSEAAQFALLVFGFTFACEKGHPTGAVRDLMLASSSLRLASVPFLFLLDLGTKEERTSAYTNALGTRMLLRLQHGRGDEDDLSRAQARARRDVAETVGSGGGGGGGEASEVFESGLNYGSVAESSLAGGLARPHNSFLSARDSKHEGGGSVEDRLGLWRQRMSARLRVPWEEGHEEVVLRRESVLEDARNAFTRLSSPHPLPPPPGAAAEPTASSSSRLRRIVRFQFIDEAGLDAGGIAREFFTVCGEAIIFDPSASFQLCESSSEQGGSMPTYQITPRPRADEEDGALLRRRFWFAGAWLGKALLDGHCVPMTWAEPIYAALLKGMPVYPVDDGGGDGGASSLASLLSDLKHYDAMLHRQLSALLSMPPADVDVLGLNFTVAYEVDSPNGDDAKGGGVGFIGMVATLLASAPSTKSETTSAVTAAEASAEATAALRKPRRVMVEVELEAGGAERDVTGACVREYVWLRCRRRVVGDVAPQLANMVRGFHSVVPMPELRGLSTADLRALLCGTPGLVDVEDWRGHTSYLGAFKPSSLLKQQHKVVLWFWSWVESLEAPQRRRLLRFVTGSPGLPVGGFAQLQGNDGKACHFTLQPLPGDVNGSSQIGAALLPRAHTCFNRLDLPLYKSKEELGRVLSAVISFDAALTGFGLE
mmetsp:Transcript_79134/g.154748  ORF Transcript_79134/g.154748 Transcript_79134/m.154748 type:complete len:1111 (-) Transcript_79134:122-3454(-)